MSLKALFGALKIDFELSGWILRFETGIRAWRLELGLELQPNARILSLEAGLRALRLDFEP